MRHELVKLAALIDWELSAMGDPAGDLAQLKMMLLDFIMPWKEFKKIYIGESSAVQIPKARTTGENNIPQTPYNSPEKNYFKTTGLDNFLFLLDLFL